MRLSVSETSKLMGVSVRTLHYYDEIGILKPSEISDAGYRYYDEEKLAVLQQILFYRELEFSLKDIIHMLSQPDHNQKEALNSHRHLLLLKQNHIEGLLRLVDQTLGGNEEMRDETFAFTDIDEARAKYAAEAKARWGHTSVYKESKRREEKRTAAESLQVMNETKDIFTAFAKAIGRSPSDPEVQTLVTRWQSLITKYHYNCTDDILYGIADMIISEDRFTKNIDRFGGGTTQFIYEAIKTYCAK